MRTTCQAKAWSCGLGMSGCLSPGDKIASPVLSTLVVLRSGSAVNSFPPQFSHCSYKLPTICCPVFSLWVLPYLC